MTVWIYKKEGDTMSNDDFMKLLEELTPENRIKVYDKYFELLAEQERESHNEDNISL